MTTIILVSIGILLAAAAALFAVFYGGDAFTGGDDKAKASTLVNAGMNVESASQGYHAEKGSLPAALSDLTGAGEGSWLRTMPVMNRATLETQEIADVGEVRLYRVAGVSAKVCGLVAKAYGAPATIPAERTGRRGCYGTGDANTFFVVLGASDAGASAAPPRAPELADDADVDAKADFIRATAAFVASSLARSTGAPSDETGGVTAIDFRGVGKGKVYLEYDDLTYNVQGMSEAVCRRINERINGNGTPYVDSTGNYKAYDEGCWNFYGMPFYWKKMEAAYASSPAIAGFPSAVDVSGVEPGKPVSYPNPAIRLPKWYATANWNVKYYDDYFYPTHIRRTYYVASDMTDFYCRLVNRASGGPDNYRDYKSWVMIRDEGCGNMGGYVYYKKIGTVDLPWGS